MRTLQIVEITCSTQKNIDNAVCIACDQIDDWVFWTPAGSGPFCGECLDALCDPDQALLLENRLAAYEDSFGEIEVKTIVSSSIDPAAEEVYVARSGGVETVLRSTTNQIPK